MGKTSSPQTSLEAIREDVRRNEAQHLKFLADGMRVSFSSLADFQSWVSGELHRIGLRVEDFAVDREEVAQQPAFQKMLRENPSFLRSGRNVVGTLRQVA